MSGYDGGELTLPVSNLEGATDFYLRALQPLGLDVTSEVQHKTKTRPPVRTRGVGLGPKGTLTTIIFLSESELGVNKTAHVVLPVSSRVEVRNIYTCALEAGAKPCRPPDYTSQHGSLFSMTIRDRDGNTFEAAYNDSVTSPSEYADESSVSGYAHGRSSPPMRSTRYTIQRRDSSSHRRHSSPSSTKERPSSRSGGGGNAIVGTLLGAAAGVALGYVAMKSKADSRHKENEHRARIQARDMMEHEARTQTYDRMSTGVVDHPPPKSRRGSNGQERDSGYSSWSREESPKRVTHRHGTWPRTGSSRRSSSVDTYSSRRSNDRRDHSTRTRDNDHRLPPPRSAQDKQSVASSQRTIRQTHYAGRVKDVSRPPSPPTVPPSRQRRASSVKNRRTVYYTSDYDCEPDRRSITSASRKGSVANALPPSSFPRKALPPVAAAPSSQASNASRSSSKVTKVLVPSIPNAPVDEPAPFREPDPSKIDDLETVVPDDSISCVGSDREEERRSRTSRHSRPSKSSRHGHRGMEVVRRAGVVLDH